MRMGRMMILLVILYTLCGGGVIAVAQIERTGVEPVDLQPPSIVKIVEIDMSAQQDVLRRWHIYFSEPVRDVDIIDFITLGTQAPFSISALSDDMYEMTIHNVSKGGDNDRIAFALLPGHAIVDRAGNDLKSDKPFADLFIDKQLADRRRENDVETPYVETAPPELLSIYRKRPKRMQTSRNKLSWRIRFSKKVLNVDASDFILTGTSADIVKIKARRKGQVYDMMIAGGDLEQLNGRVDVRLAEMTDISDRHGNRLVVQADQAFDNAFMVYNDVSTPADSVLEPAEESTHSNRTDPQTVLLPEPIEVVDSHPVPYVEIHHLPPLSEAPQK